LSSAKSTPQYNDIQDYLTNFNEVVNDISFVSMLQENLLSMTFHQHKQKDCK